MFMNKRSLANSEMLFILTLSTPHATIVLPTKKFICKNILILSSFLVLRIRIYIRIRMDPHDFGLLNPHPESAIQMRIPDSDADPD
jgi:hypothetical protein